MNIFHPAILQSNFFFLLLFVKVSWFEICQNWSRFILYYIIKVRKCILIILFYQLNKFVFHWRYILVSSLLCTLHFLYYQIVYISPIIIIIIHKIYNSNQILWLKVGLYFTNAIINIILIFCIILSKEWLHFKFKQ